LENFENIHEILEKYNEKSDFEHDPLDINVGYSPDRHEEKGVDWAQLMSRKSSHDSRQQFP